MKRIRIYKVIKEYPTYYLAEDIKTHVKECFNKIYYKVDSEGHIRKIFETFHT